MSTNRAVGVTGRAAVLLVTVFALLACGGGGGGGGSGASLAALAAAGSSPAAAPAPAAASPSPTPALAISRVETTFIVARNVNHTFPISIWLPASYDGGSQRYPTIYALDGDANNGLQTTRFENLQAVLQRLGTQAILVGIGGTVRRQTDYNLPGSDNFHAFLAKELIPLIDARYRTDPARRMLSGLSTGGNFVLIELFTTAPDGLVFNVFHASDGAFWQQEGQLYGLETDMSARVGTRLLTVTLVLDSSSTGNTRNVEAMRNRIAARSYRDLTLLGTVFSLGHVQMDVPSFEGVVRRAYP